MSVKGQIFINNKGIDGEIANNMTFDFDFNVDKNILEKIKAKKESDKLNTKDWALFPLMVLFIFAMGVVSGCHLGAGAVVSAYGRRVQAVSWYIIQIRE